jgi:hypothetical protein
LNDVVGELEKELFNYFMKLEYEWYKKRS